MCESYLSQGISILLDQAMRDETKAIFLKLAQKYQAQVFQFHLTAPRDVLLDRLSKRPKAALAKTPIPQSRILKNLRIHAKQTHDDAITIDSSIRTPEEIAMQITKDLAKMRASSQR